MLEANEGRDEHPEQRQHIIGAAVRQFAFRMVPHAFIGVEFGCVGGEVRDAPARLTGEERAELRAAVNVAVVPQHDDAPAEVSEQGTEKRAGVRGANVVPIELEVEAAASARRAEREPGDHRHAIVALPMPKHGRLYARRPGPPDRRNQEEARLVDEDEIGAQPRGVFFSRGQSRCFHAAIAASSRWSARRSGFCTVQPNRWRSRPT